MAARALSTLIVREGSEWSTEVGAPGPGDSRGEEAGTWSSKWRALECFQFS